MAKISGLLTSYQLALLAVVYIPHQDPSILYVPYNDASRDRFCVLLGNGWLAKREMGKKAVIDTTREGELVLTQYTRAHWVLSLTEHGYNMEALFYIGLMDKEELAELLVHEDEDFRRAAAIRFCDLEVSK